MKLNLDNNASAYQFTSYIGNAVVIGDNQYHSSLIVTPKAVYPNWPPTRLEDITTDHLQKIIELKPELILIGTGEKQKFPPTSILEVAALANLGVDFMDTRAACRTYNVLAAENRRVAAGIILEHMNTYLDTTSLDSTSQR